MGNTKWEYQFVTFSDKFWWEEPQKVIERLDEEGDKGWEIVNISVDTGTGNRYLMKREKPIDAARPGPPTAKKRA